MSNSNLTRIGFSDSISAIGITTASELPPPAQNWIPSSREVFARKRVFPPAVSAPKLLVDNSISTYSVVSAAHDLFVKDYLFSISSQLNSPATGLRLADRANQNLVSIIDQIESCSLEYSSPDLQDLSQKAVDAMRARHGEDLSELADRLSEESYE